MKAVLFDMDGTLLPMDAMRFAKGYFTLLSHALAPHGYDSDKLVRAIMHGIGAMVCNDGSRTNADVFWNDMAGIYGKGVLSDAVLFDEFYKNDFCRLRAECGFEPGAAKLVARLKSAGMTLALATNPVFPREAQLMRIGWAGVDPGDFALITAYENSHYCKPSPDYYIEIMQKLGVDASDCLMIGNDVGEDGAAVKAGIKTFILTPCLIAPAGADLGAFPHGGYAELNEFLTEQGVAQ